MTTPELHHGFGKLVLSGDAIVIRDRAVDGPPPSRVVVLSNISCPKIARRTNTGEYTSDEPFAWQAREFVRSKVIGREVYYTVDNGELSDRVFGCVFIKNDGNLVNLAHLIVEEGLARVRRNMSPAMLERGKMKDLIALEENAQLNKKGIWSDSLDGAPRKICWNVSDSAEFFSKFGKKHLRGIVEYVRDGSSMQVMLLPINGDPEGAYYSIMLLLSGIKTPGSKMSEGERINEPFATEAQFFVESRLLQREVTVILESVMNNNFVGSVLHPNGNIAQCLLEEGLAKCLEWNLSIVSKEAGGMEEYKKKEQIAKKNRRLIWKDFNPPQVAKGQPGKEGKAENDSAASSVPKEYSGTVVEVGNGDNVLVRCQDGQVRKFFLSSIRPPRPVGPVEGAKPQQQQGQFRPLYQVPWMYDAREFLRKRLIGKNVKVLVDYIQPKPEGSNFSERVCATIYDNANVAEALVTRGLATVVRYRNSADSRARDYDALLKAEAAAEQRQVGLFDKKKKEPRVHKVIEIGETVKPQSYVHTLQRRENVDALVEYVFSVSKLRVEITAESLLCSISPFGIDIPYARKASNQPGPEEDAFADEAKQFVHDLVMHRNVIFSMNSLNKQGTFIGHIGLRSEVKVSPAGDKKTKKGGKFISSKDLSEVLVAKGYATVSRHLTNWHPSYYRKLIDAEEFARNHSLGIWSSGTILAKWSEGVIANQQMDMEPENQQSDGLMFVRDLQDALPDEAVLNKAKADRQATGFMARAIWREDAQLIEPPTGKNSGVRFFVYKGDSISKLKTLLAPLNSQGFPSPEAVSNFQPRRGMVCAVMSPLRRCWCRSRILRLDSKSFTVLLIDYGYEETISKSVAQFASLSDSLKSAPPLATEYRLAYVQLPIDSDDRVAALNLLRDKTQNVDIRLFPVNKGAPTPCGADDKRPVPSVVVQVCQNKAGSSQVASGDVEDVAEFMLANGFVFMENVRMPPDLCVSYSQAEELARKKRYLIWHYGDFRGDEDE
nr:SNase domain containing protein [Hymenolepis microstoma]